MFNIIGYRLDEYSHHGCGNKQKLYFHLPCGFAKLAANMYISLVHKYSMQCILYKLGRPISAAAPGAGPGRKVERVREPLGSRLGY